MTKENQKVWIQAGYETFAKEGISGLKVEALARKTGKSKSSFYHYFADMEVFTQLLLQQHRQNAKVIAGKMKICKNMIPDMLHILLEAKQDVLFNRQLRINRHIPEFNNCFRKAHQPVEEALLPFWANTLGLTDKKYLARMILNLTVENFYLRVTENTFTYNWLTDYIDEIRVMVAEMRKDFPE
ncbi:TetR/AcrR family transcriptional regulator [Sphingobacteriales bacterium UPWRP_1]|nr:TetR family transcriptional regulator [Sphingobacteriales bacterium TSM_CSS]PSJ77187.1 TetR/AcrR family transcriptional regulator [Sphingobacteriales bacterium UPWRP_1]